MHSSILPTLFALAAFAAPAAAQCGDGIRVLSVPASAPLGAPVDMQLGAPPNSLALLMISLGDGPLDAGSYGTLCLDFPLAGYLIVPIDAAGQGHATECVPCDDLLVGVEFYLQFLTCNGALGRAGNGSSNLQTILIEDALGPGSLATFAQADFDQGCETSDVGCRLDTWFDAVFPGGVLIGDQDGNDDDTCYVSLWTTSQAIRRYLPQTSRCQLLHGDHQDPKSESGYKWGAELLAAKLNVGLDDAGAFDDLKCRDDLKLGDLVLRACVAEELVGLSVRDLLEISDMAICGGLGQGPFDLDGDGVGDVGKTDLCNALEVVNLNFRAGTVDLGCLDVP